MFNLDRAIRIQNEISLCIDKLKKRTKADYQIEIDMALSFFSTGTILLSIKKEDTEIFKASVHASTNIRELEEKIKSLLVKHQNAIENHQSSSQNIKRHSI